MSLSFSFSTGYLALTGVYGQNGENSPVGTLKTTHTSGNLKVKIYPTWYKQIALEWSVPADWGAVLFNVYFSQSEDGPFEKLNGAPIDGTYLLDTTTQEYLKFNRGFYVVEAILLDKNSVTIRSTAESWQPFQRHNVVGIRGLDMQRRELILLSKFSGIKSFLFRRRTYGQRCPECWSPKANKLLKDHCETCFGTSFKGGYFPAAPFWGNYNITPNQKVRSYSGVSEPNVIGMWTISYPEIRPDDVVVRSGDWNMYRIDHVEATELQGNPVHQNCTLNQFAKSDVEYKLLTATLPDFPKYPQFTGTADFPDQYK